jgi:hypothetical protein
VKLEEELSIEPAFYKRQQQPVKPVLQLLIMLEDGRKQFQTVKSKVQLSNEYEMFSVKPELQLPIEFRFLRCIQTKRKNVESVKSES